MLPSHLLKRRDGFLTVVALAVAAGSLLGVFALPAASVAAANANFVGTWENAPGGELHDCL